MVIQLKGLGVIGFKQQPCDKKEIKEITSSKAQLMGLNKIKKNLTSHILIIDFSLKHRT